jgi:outer membrane protein insertion porin family
MKILLLFILALISSSFASSVFVLEDVIVDCKKSIVCTQRTSRFKTLLGEYRSIVHLKDTLKVMASDGGYQTFTYSLEKENEKYILKIHFSMKPVIEDISVGFTDRNIEENPSQLVSIREGDFFETQKLKESMEGLQKKLDSLGFPNNSHSYEVIDKDGKVDINIVITLGEPRIFKNMDTDSKSLFVRDFLERKFLNLYNKPFDFNKFKMSLDEAQKELFSYGYYLINLDFTPVFKGNRVNLDIKVQNDEIYAFDFKNLQREHRDIIHELVVDQFRKYKRPLTEAALAAAIKQHYKSKSLLNAKVRIETSQYKNKSNETVNLYRISLDENGKTRLVDVSFNGNSYFKTSKLKKMFDQEAFELASINYYDEEYFIYFQEYLRNRYIEKGFVQVKIFDPVQTFDAHKQSAKVEFNIQEGPRAYVRNILFTGLPENLEDKVLSVMANKTGNPFNPIKMVDDIKTVATTLQNEGYYYAEVTNSNENDIVKYNKAGTDVIINFKIDAGPVVKLNRVLYLGNDTTRKKVLAKKVFLEKGDLITPAKTRDIESSISATGLFNSVNVTPIRHNSKNASTDLLVRVTERDYKLLEVAPGYRTDLGLKLTGTVTFQNIGGYNRTISLRSQVNRRTSFTTIDPERRDNIKHILEHNTSFSYNEGDIFDTLIDAAFTAAYQTRRFYSFDANILRSNVTLTRDITKRVSTSLRYQYEDITQYNATEELNNGSFQIGAITPSLTYDLRNNQINPTKGAFFNLSTEFANPYFLSQKEPDLTINYYRLISRNRFYIPFKNGTFAISLVGGIQENLAREKVTVNGTQQTEGYIPTIKVFRLTGMDIIRGFTDEEMNRLPDGRDISDVRVSNRAYMTNIKLEPRYFINDTLMIGGFYDAGRVFVDRMDLGDLRDSVGITFKIVTPVGTLDFDYGIKLLRKKDASGRLEDPGRFHVSIGFF